ncbi:TPA: hypothetical protein ACGOVM_002031 [Streptococcus suis]
MTVTDKDYNELSERVYNVDSGKKDVVHIQQAQEIMDGKFQVLAVEDNTANGMQAMAVAPVVNCD